MEEELKTELLEKEHYIQDFPDFKNIFYVEGLTANLISINQLCDNGMLVKFNKYSSEVYEDSNKCVMFGSRSWDNCYQADNEGKCHSVKLDETELWHQRLRHAAMKNIQKLLKYNVVQGLPKLDFKEDSNIRFCSLYDCCVVRIRTNYGKEFENSSFAGYCSRKGISHEFSAPKIPQQNRVVELTNCTLLEMVRLILHTKHLSKSLWAEAVNTACHLFNRVYLRPGTKMTPYEILKGKKSNLKHLRVFGCVCYILNDRDDLNMVDQKSNKVLFLGYAPNNMAYRVSNLHTKTIQESVNIVFDDAGSLIDRSTEEDDHSTLIDDWAPSETDIESTSETTSSRQSNSDPEEDVEIPEYLFSTQRSEPTWRIRKYHPSTLIITTRKLVIDNGEYMLSTSYVIVV